MSVFTRSACTSQQRQVNFQRVHRELPQPAQGSRSDPIIIKNQSNPHVLEMGEHGDCQLRIGRGNAFCHLRLQSRRIDPRFLQRRLHGDQQPSVTKLPRQYGQRPQRTPEPFA
jgi:hypothetical protein